MISKKLYLGDKIELFLDLPHVRLLWHCKKGQKRIKGNKGLGQVKKRMRISNDSVAQVNNDNIDNTDCTNLLDDIEIETQDNVSNIPVRVRKITTNFWPTSKRLNIIWELAGNLFPSSNDVIDNVTNTTYLYPTRLFDK